VIQRQGPMEESQRVTEAPSPVVESTMSQTAHTWGLQTHQTAQHTRTSAAMEQPKRLVTECNSTHAKQNLMMPRERLQQLPHLQQSVGARSS
jgi:hypothetical protein